MIIFNKLIIAVFVTHLYLFRLWCHDFITLLCQDLQYQAQSIQQLIESNVEGHDMHHCAVEITLRGFFENTSLYITSSPCCPFKGLAGVELRCEPQQSVVHRHTGMRLHSDRWNLNSTSNHLSCCHSFMWLGKSNYV